MPASPHKQSRRMSLIEAIANIGVGYSVAVAMQMLAFPLFGLDASLEENLALGALFTIASVCRSYLLRRIFESLRVRGLLAVDDARA
ncbi:conserved hypothetical protein [uncultured Defluviicoccus sp.]|uniref:Uncharacterized protein n=1 Tax=metagenome TaxID=256318 RepID=A0A380TL40_9ZZZZ|nr:conserved hypothetical protein [uncultured Defluviicoccus sp.]